MNTVTCGCDCHEIELNDNNVVKWQDKVWTPVCALRESTRLLGKTNQELKETKEKLKKSELAKQRLDSLVTDLEHLTCPVCNRIIGKSWTFSGGSVCCKSCI